MGITEIDASERRIDLSAVNRDSVVAEMEKKWPIMTNDFKRIQQEQYILFCRKQKNYGPDSISLGTTLERPDDKKLSLQGLFFRLNDKINRYKQMIMFGSEDAVGEPLEDTFKDISVYGIIAQLVKNGTWGR